MPCKTLLCKLLVIITFFIFNDKKIHAQCTVSISGDTCVNNYLKASTTTGVFQQLDWYHEGSLWYSAKVTGYNPAGTTVGTGIDVPAGLCKDRFGNIYVASLNSGSIIKFTPGSVTGTVVLSGITDPNDVAIYNDTLYIAGVNNGGLYKWTIGTPAAIKIISLPEGHAGWGVCVDKRNNVYFAANGTATSTIYRLRPGTTEPQVVARGKANAFEFVLDIDVDRDGNLYIADFTEDDARVIKLAPGDSTGIVVAGGNGYGSNDNQLTFPVQIFLDRMNNLFIADQDNHRISKWAPGASAGITIAGGFSIVAGDALTLPRPRGVYIDSAGDLLASDITKSSVISYSPLKGVYKKYIPPATGNYTVVATDTIGCVSTSNSIYVNTVPPPPASIAGPVSVSTNQQNIVYSVTALPGETYTWTVPATVTIISGQGTSSITVNWGNKTGNVSVTAANGCGNSIAKSLKVRVSGSLIAASDASGIKQQVIANKLSLYPNPSADHVTVEHPATIHPATLRIISMTGKTIKIITVAKSVSQTNISLNGLLPGIYTVTWTDGTNTKNKMLVVI